MSHQGLLIDYEFCSGCHACEVACKKALNLPKGQYGIQVVQVGPWPIDEENEKWQFKYIPVPTDLCDMCEGRVSEGRLPACVHHCQSLILRYGKVEELAPYLDEKPQRLLYSVKA
jgi:Fe-S-cluster-containing dehydrogenase component